MNAQHKPLVVLISKDQKTPGLVRNAIEETADLVHAEDMYWAKKLIFTTWARVDVIIFDRGAAISEYIEFINEIAAYLPHVQFALAFENHELERVISIKNQVTLMSVILLPWDGPVLKTLVGSLADRAAQVRKRESYLAQSLVDEFRRTRDNRMLLCFQAFAGEVHTSRGGKLLPFFLAAKQHQTDETTADLAKFDNFIHIDQEARRIAAIAGHVRNWWKEFDERGSLPTHQPFFAVNGDIIGIRKPKLQFSPINGACYVDPGYDACGLMAWLLITPEKMSIRLLEEASVWVVEPAPHMPDAPGDSEFQQILPASR